MAVVYIPPVKRTNPLALDCDGDSHSLDIGAWTPGKTALTLAGIYINVDAFTLTDSTKPGRLRIFMRRAAWSGDPVDDTYFYDLWLERSGYGHLDTRSMFEKADAGRPLTWRYQCNGLSKVVLSTRFVKYAQVT